MTRTIVLGWDALDIELIDDFGLNGRFGQYQTKIGTFNNEKIGLPHTKEVWPSIISGLPPADHGIHAVTKDEGIQWDSSLLNTASSLANGVVPKTILSPIGRKLRERGHKVDIKRADHYWTDIPTIFDAPNRRALSIPNYQTPYDRAQTLDANRNNVWAELLAERDGSEGFTPAVEMPEVYDILGREVGRRLGQVIGQYHAGHELVFCWFGCLDTVGHVAPTTDAPLQRDWYEVAANVTETVQACVSDDTRVMCLSDHGLQDGEHTEYATLTADDPKPTAKIESVFDVCPFLSGTVSGGGETAGVDAEAMADAKDSLEELGYL